MGVAPPVGVGVGVAPPTVKTRRQVSAGSRAGAGFGAVGAIGWLPVLYSFIAVKTAIIANTIVAKPIKIRCQFSFNLSIFSTNLKLGYISLTQSYKLWLKELCIEYNTYLRAYW